MLFSYVIPEREDQVSHHHIVMRRKGVRFITHFRIVLMAQQSHQAARRFLPRSPARAVSRDGFSTNRPVTYLCSTLEISVW